MPSQNATVRTADVRQALDFLDGLELILRVFDERSAGEDVRPALLAALQSMDSEGHNWEPLRYGGGPAQGWRFVGRNVADLRSRLVQSYGDAALGDPTS